MQIFTLGWPLLGGKDAMDQGCGPVTLNSSNTLLALSSGDCEPVMFFFLFSSDSCRLGCRVPRMAPNVEVNLCRLLALGKSDLSSDKCRVQLDSFRAWSFVSKLKVRKSTISWPRGVNPRPTPATELMTSDLTCPSTHQLLRSISLVLARASLAAISKLLSSSGYSRGDYTSSVGS
ncbi:hypothetical protein Tco_1365128 [Tanacetum coccineum]